MKVGKSNASPVGRRFCFCYFLILVFKDMDRVVLCELVTQHWSKGPGGEILEEGYPPCSMCYGQTGGGFLMPRFYS